MVVRVMAVVVRVMAEMVRVEVVVRVVLGTGWILYENLIGLF